MKSDMNARTPAGVIAPTVLSGKFDAVSVRSWALVFWGAAMRNESNNAKAVVANRNISLLKFLLVNQEGAGEFAHWPPPRKRRARAGSDLSAKSLGRNFCGKAGSCSGTDAETASRDVAVADHTINASVRERPGD